MQDLLASICLYWRMSICTVCHHAAMAFLVLLSEQSHSLLSDVLRRDLAGGIKLPYKLLSLINCQ